MIGDADFWYRMETFSSNVTFGTKAVSGRPEAPTGGNLIFGQSW